MCPFHGWIRRTNSFTSRSLPSASALSQWPPRRWAFPEALAGRGGISGVAVVTWIPGFLVESAWCPGFWSACVGWESSLGSAFGEALERRTEDRRKDGTSVRLVITKHGCCRGRAACRGAVAWGCAPSEALATALCPCPLRMQQPKLPRLLTRRRLGLGARPSSGAHHTQGSARVPPAFQPGSAHRTHGGCRAYGPGSGEWRVLKPSRLRCGGRCVLRLSELGLPLSLLLSMKAVEGGRSVTVNTWQGTPSQG